VVREGVYDFREQSLFDLIRFCGGLKHNADSNAILVTRFKPDGKGLDSRTLSYPDDCKNYIVHFDDNITVGQKPYWHEPVTAYIWGRIHNPGTYILTPGQTIDDLLKMAGGILEDGDPEAAYLRRAGVIDTLASNNFVTELNRGFLLSTNRLVVDFEKIQVGKKKNLRIQLEPFDAIYIPRKAHGVSVIGKVVSPGIVKFRAGKNWEYYVNLAGTFDKDAFKSKSLVYKPGKGAWISVINAGPIKSGDIIFVPEIPFGYRWERFRDVITISTALFTTVFLYLTLR